MTKFEPTLDEYRIIKDKKVTKAKLTLSMNLCFFNGLEGYGIDITTFGFTLSTMKKHVYSEIPLLMEGFTLHIQGVYHLKAQFEKAEINMVELGQDLNPILKLVVVVDADEALNGWLYYYLGKHISVIAIELIQMTLMDLNKPVGAVAASVEPEAMKEIQQEKEATAREAVGATVKAIKAIDKEIKKS